MDTVKFETKEDLARIYEDFSEGLYRYIFYRVNSSQELAEDLQQQVIIKAWKRRSSYDPNKSSFKNWLYTIAHNSIVDHFRKTNREEPISEEEPEEENMSLDDLIMVDTIVKCMEQLKDIERNMLMLRYIEGFSVNEIARITGKNESATKVALFRALKKLKEIMGVESATVAAV